MKSLLRSVFVADSNDNPELMLRNYQLLLGSGLGFEVPEYEVIWAFVQEFVRTHSHVPNLTTLRSHFEHAKEESVLDQLMHLEGLKARTKGDFQKVLEDKANDRRQRLWAETLKEASIITSTGMEVVEGREKRLLKGPIQSARYVVEKAHDIVAPTIGGRLSGEVTKDGNAAKEEYERVEGDPLAGIGQFTFLAQADAALSGAKRHELWIHAAFTGGMKCVTGGTRIFDVATGALRTVQELFQSREAPQVHALAGGKVGVYQASPIISQGVRPVFKVQSESGRAVRVSGNHPFLTPEGYVNADQLQAGDWVAVAAQMALPGNPTRAHFSDEEIKVLGYLLGDGRIKEDITFTNSKALLRKDFIRSIEAMGLRSGKEGYANYPYYRKVLENPCASDRRRTVQTIRVSRSNGEGNHPWVSPVRRLLDRVGLYGCGSSEKFIPRSVWGCSDEQIWLFLSALWATDGHLGHEKGRAKHTARPSAWYASTSHTLALDIQLLLQRVGVHTSVREVKTKVRGEPYSCWYVRVLHRNLGIFLDRIAPAGKNPDLGRARKAFNKGTKYDGGRIPVALLKGLPDSLRIPSRSGWIYARWAKKQEWVSGWVADRFAQHPECPEPVRQALTRDVVWERLDSVLPDGVEETFDLSVPGPANFVAEGFITHNSTFMLNWAYNQAVIYQHNVLIFSLEMPYPQCRRILYAIHSRHPKFRDIRMQLGIQKDPEQDEGLPYQQIRDGLLNDWHPNAKQFYFDYVIPDFNGEDVIKHPYLGCDYGKIHIEVADPDKHDFTMDDLRSMAEVIYSNDPFSLLFVDHCGLMSPRRHRNSTTENLNEVVRDLKKLALGFNRGQGMAVVGLFQISREGYKAALKQKEKTGVAGYNLTHLSYANECCKYTELLRFSDGMRPISTAMVGDEVWSSSGWRVVRHVFDQGVRPLWAVTTDRGSKLECTGNHQVRVVRDGSLTWGRVDTLKPGDYVAGSFAGGGPREPSPLPSSWAGVSTLTEDIAYVLGAWHGDGRIRPNGIGFTGNRNEAELKSRLHSTLGRVHGSKSPVVHHMVSRPGSFDMELYDTEFKKWFEGVAGSRVGDVPAVVLGSPDAHRSAFLRGLFDTDGWINKAGVVGIKMKAAREPFLRQVQLVMQALGIDTHLSFGSDKLKATGKTYHSVTLRVRSRRGREEFARLVGFTETHKQKTLQAFLEAGRESVKRGDVSMYPVQGTFLRAYEQVRPAGSSRRGYTPGFLDAPRKALQGGLVSRGNIEKLLRHARDKGVWGDDFEFLRILVEDLLVMQVVSVQSTGDEARVWDLEVGGDYEYQTGPLLSHNCERSADVVTSTWIDDDLKDQNRVQFNCLKSRDQAPFAPFVARVEWGCRRLLTTFDMPLTAEEAAKKGADIDQATKELEKE